MSTIIIIEEIQEIIIPALLRTSIVLLCSVNLNAGWTFNLLLYDLDCSHENERNESVHEILSIPMMLIQAQLIT